MSFGVGAKVLEPESLVKEINEDLTKIALRYAEHVD
jgi:predicted DNA-binding transcriptional regulator YafY